jgi:hypothetical protein
MVTANFLVGWQPEDEFEMRRKLTDRCSFSSRKE